MSNESPLNAVDPATSNMVTVTLRPGVNVRSIKGDVVALRLAAYPAPGGGGLVYTGPAVPPNTAVTVFQLSGNPLDHRIVGSATSDANGAWSYTFSAIPTPGTVTFKGLTSVQVPAYEAAILRRDGMAY